MPPWVAVGPGDDAAVIEPERGALEVLTTDAQVDGVHFDRRFVPPSAIGHRALAVNLSDLAAMGARPRAFLLSLALPPDMAADEFDQLMEGLLAVASASSITLIGGNITRTPGPLMIDVTALGSVRPRGTLTRAGARPGDDVYVTGTLGEGAVGLWALQAALSGGPEGCPPQGPVAADADSRLTQWPHSVERYLRPQARIRAGVLLGRNRAASSCMDLSDGLADGVSQIATASGVGITIDGAAVPIGAEVQAWHTRAADGSAQLPSGDALHTALTGGDDYELLFTVRPSQRGRLRTVVKQLGALPITRIGVVTKARDLLVRERGGVRQLPAGYEHFR